MYRCANEHAMVDRIRLAASVSNLKRRVHVIGGDHQIEAGESSAGNNIQTLGLGHHLLVVQDALIIFGLNFGN